MKLTSNYSLKKPDGSDVVNVQDFNDNSDKIDLELKKVDSSLKEIANKVDNIKIADGTTTTKGIVKLNNATDSTSQTEAATPLAVKTAMDKANEAFQYASNGKSLIAGKVGNVTGSNTHAEIANRIQTDKNTLANNLKNKNVSASGNEALASLANKVNNINIENMGYTSYGKQLWMTSSMLFYGERAVSIDSSGDIYSCNSSGYIKFDKYGKLIYQRSIADSLYELLIDKSKNIYEIHYKYIYKTDSNGTKLWERTSNASTSGCLDNNGNLYINAYGKYIMKIDPNGRQIWSSSSRDTQKIRINKSNVLFCYTYDNYVKKIDLNTGNVIWQRHFPSKYSGCRINDIVIDSTGCFYLCYKGDDERVLKFNPNTNTEIWSIPKKIWKLAIDKSDNIYYYNSDGNIDKINSRNGQVFWSFRLPFKLSIINIDNFYNIYCGCYGDDDPYTIILKYGEVYIK